MMRFSWIPSWKISKTRFLLPVFFFELLLRKLIRQNLYLQIFHHDKVYRKKMIDLLLISDSLLIKPILEKFLSFEEKTISDMYFYELYIHPGMFSD